MLFGKKKERITIEQLAATLRTNYKEVVAHAKQQFYELEKYGIELPSNADLEITLMAYAAFDYAMSQGPEIELRNKLRDLFLELDMPNQELLKNIVERCDEYSDVLNHMKNGDLVRLKVGKVLAKHLGHEDDPRIAGVAGIHFESIVNTMSGTTSECIRQIAK